MLQFIIIVVYYIIIYPSVYLPFIVCQIACGVCMLRQQLPFSYNYSINLPVYFVSFGIDTEPEGKCYWAQLKSANMPEQVWYFQNSKISVSNWVSIYLYILQIWSTVSGGVVWGDQRGPKSFILKLFMGINVIIYYEYDLYCVLWCPCAKLKKLINRLGGMALLQLTFPGEGNSNFS